MPKREQLNLRLPEGWFDVLETAGYLEDQTVAEYVKDLLEHRVAELEHDDDVKAIRRRKAERRAMKSRKLTRLRDRQADEGA